VLLAVSEYVDVQSFFGDIVGLFGLAGTVVIGADDRLPLSIEVVLQLDNKPRSLALLAIVADACPNWSSPSGRRR
jgi:hypothetical protein